MRIFLANSIIDIVDRLLFSLHRGKHSRPALGNEWAQDNWRIPPVKQQTWYRRPRDFGLGLWSVIYNACKTSTITLDMLMLPYSDLKSHRCAQPRKPQC